MVKVKLEKENIKNTDNKKVLISVDRKNYSYLKDYLDKHNLNFSKMIDDLISFLVPNLKKGHKKFELDLNLEGEDT